MSARGLLSVEQAKADTKQGNGALAPQNRPPWLMRKKWPRPPCSPPRSIIPQPLPPTLPLIKKCNETNGFEAYSGHNLIQGAVTSLTPSLPVSFYSHWRMTLHLQSSWVLPLLPLESKNTSTCNSACYKCCHVLGTFHQASWGLGNTNGSIHQSLEESYVISLHTPHTWTLRLRKQKGPHIGR